MQYTTLGRTGLRVSVMGLGCGGPSQLGQRTGKTRAESVRVVREALDLGVNLLDTAEQYITEDIVGEALSEVRREDVVVCTKRSTWKKGTPPPTADQFTASLEASLKRLRTDYLDVYYLHGIRPAIYTEARDALVPVMMKMRDQGKIRFIGLTEAFELDPGHTMVQDAFKDDFWEVMMIGFNILHQTARKLVLPETMRQDIGTIVMFAVRRALSQPERLKEVLADLRARGQVAPDVLKGDDPLGFLVREYGAESVQDAAYRFCRHEPGVQVVLAGTGDVDHLKTNAESINRPDLSSEARRLLERLFVNADGAVGN